MAADGAPTFSEQVKALTQGLANYRMQGAKRTVCDALVYLLQYHPERDRSFDLEHGTDTSGRISPTKLTIHDSAAARSAMVYVASPAPVTRWMLKKINVDVRDFTFVDIGCGKGRALLVASELPFQRVIGVEISQELSKIAEANVRLFRQRVHADVEILNADAATVVLPTTPTLFHLYHPFDESMLARVLENISATHQKTPCKRIVAYLLPSGVDHRVCTTFAKFSFLNQVAYYPSLAGEYDWAIYSTDAS